MPSKPNPITKEEEVQQNADPHIDQDFPGFPHHPATKKSITPKTDREKKVAAANKRRSRRSYGG